jgi:hypothetical protein
VPSCVFGLTVLQLRVIIRGALKVAERIMMLVYCASSQPLFIALFQIPEQPSMLENKIRSRLNLIILKSWNIRNSWVYYCSIEMLCWWTSKYKRNKSCPFFCRSYIIFFVSFCRSYENCIYIYIYIYVPCTDICWGNKERLIARQPRRWMAWRSLTTHYIWKFGTYKKCPASNADVLLAYIYGYTVYGLNIVYTATQIYTNIWKKRMYMIWRHIVITYACWDHHERYNGHRNADSKSQTSQHCQQFDSNNS